MEVQVYGSARRSIVVAAVAGFAGGCLVGYLVARKLGQQELDRRVGEEVDAVRKHYAARARNDPTPQANEERTALGGDIEELREIGRAAYTRGPAMGARRTSGSVGRLLPRIETPGFGVGDQGNTGGGLPHPGDDEEPEDGTADGGDISIGIAGPDAEGLDPAPWPAEDPESGIEQFPSVELPGGSLPLLITRTEFYGDDESATGYEKLSITYYEGDGVLADDKNVPIRNAATVVGGDWQDGFGTPDEPDIVYVRNNKLQIDFEIVRDERGFAQVILNYGKPQ